LQQPNPATSKLRLFFTNDRINYNPIW